MKKSHTSSVILAAVVLALLSGHSAFAQTSREDMVVTQSTEVLNEIMAIPAKGIPHSLLEKAEGVVIIPNMIKGGFVVGVRHGRGVVLVRNENRGWQPPQFVTMTGGSVGWQAGIQATDVVLVFQTKKSIQGLLTGKFTIGVDASAAAGPVGRQASAGTDLSLQSEIYSYSRSRGLFVGAAVDGSSLQIDTLANRNYYASTGLTPTGQPATNTPVLPASAVQLLQTIAKYADNAVIQPETTTYEVPQEAVEMNPAMTPAQNAIGIDQLRMELAAASNRLGSVLDNQWKGYLALPKEVFEQGPHPNPQTLKTCIARYDQVAGNANYAPLTQRPDFQHVHGLLITYTDALAAMAAENGEIRLPPPPGSIAPQSVTPQPAGPQVISPQGVAPQLVVPR
ncbi:Ysc84 actin-binding domain protein [Bremerella cremea]|uniref:Ysc84 actin-binding domain protein n=1 Tax=Blastopirellula marina TaxID=124 RepID=A0A2S8FFI4_9BACT|nr:MULTISPECIES: lipid-binding SYLF domain-containing protein [Pirellulaceae]PQO30912.1 Ysc84 actin-binding domain protein [Blastopirellula marina]RCS44059.1 Ysc84 actin-binding domain protein [Bremerella cremea]